MQNLLVLNIVGLTPDLLTYMPKISAVGNQGFISTLTPSLPAVTCTSQATMLTGTSPKEHGIVGNGWYFRDLSEIWFWRQSNHLIQKPKVWDLARNQWGDSFSCAKMFWWYNMYAKVDISVTPRPVYPSDGRKIPSIYTEPPNLKHTLVEQLGRFPLFNFWGPTADIRSSGWIAQATRTVMRTQRPSLTLCYLPHLDYDLQRFGPHSSQAKRAAQEIDQVAGDLIDEAFDLGYEVLVVSEYGIETVSQAVHINRILREHGWLRVQDVDTGWELLDAGASQAFAVADHQMAHIYIQDETLIPKVQRVLESYEGIEIVLDETGKCEAGLDHPRSGELIAIAAPEHWFSYYYWLDPQKAPDFAPTVDIHRKPGYDPLELFVNPNITWPKLHIGRRLLKKILGFRYYMDVIGTDTTMLKGSHGRLPSTPDFGPMCLSSSKIGASDHMEMQNIQSLILDIMGNKS